MKINDFESYIDEKILERGYGYYLNENVKKVKRTGDKGFIATVEGSTDYEVFVEVGANGEILSSQCDCPYDFGPICKHEAAVFFKLREVLEEENNSKLAQGNGQGEPDIKSVLNNLSKEQLIDIILGLTDDDPVLEKSLIFKYSRKDDKQELKATRELIHSIVRQHVGRNGFLIGSRKTFAFVNDLEVVAEKARNTENPLLALDIALLLLKEAFHAFSYADDSYGHIGSLIDSTFDLIEEIAFEIEEEGHQTKEAFEKILSMSESRVLEGWDNFRIDLLSICTVFADDDKLRKRLKDKIDAGLSRGDDDNFSKYEKEELLKLMYSLVEEYESPEAAEQFINEHLQFPFFREQLLIKLLREKDYHKVIEVAEDGEKQDKNLLGLVSEWKKYRYKAYKHLSLKEEQKKLAKELLLNGDFDYYYELKELFADQFDEFYANLKAELKKDKWHPSQTFLKIIEEENDLEELLQCIKEHPSYIEEYSEKLAGEYKDAVIEIYEQHIANSAKRSSNRREYKNVCKIIKKYKQIAGKERQDELIDQLIALYKRRPAFIDELEKLKRQKK